MSICQIYDLCAETLWLGRYGENGARDIAIDVGRWFADLGTEGTVVLVNWRPGEDDTPYNPNVTMDGSRVVWSPSSIDLAISGRGFAELRYYVGNSLAKSKTFRTVIDRTPSEGANPPSAAEDWVERMEDAAVTAQTASETAVDAAETATEGAQAVAQALPTITQAAQTATTAATTATNAATEAAASEEVASVAANAAQAASETATAASQTAVSSASTATTKAAQAVEAASTATAKASEATQAATTATANAQTSTAKAEEATTAAATATSNATEATTAASTASAAATTASGAASTATSAASTATAAKTAAQTAQTGAETAQTAAESAAASVTASAEQIETNTSDISEIKADLSFTNKTIFGTETTVNMSSEPGGWRLDESNGCAVANASYKLVKYQVTAGQYLKIVSDDRFQFQTVASVPGNPPSNKVGDTYQNGTFLVTVPVGATYLIMSTTLVNSGISVTELSNPITLVVGELQDQVKDIEDDAKELTLELEASATYNGYFKLNSTALTSSTDLHTKKYIIPVGATKIYVKTRFSGLMGVAFSDITDPTTDYLGYPANCTKDPLEAYSSLTTLEKTYTLDRYYKCVYVPYYVPWGEPTVIAYRESAFDTFWEGIHPLEGKNILTFGDSITYTSARWRDEFYRITRAKEIACISNVGAHLTDYNTTTPLDGNYMSTADGGVHNVVCNQVYYWLTNMPSEIEPDIIIISAGTNDTQSIAQLETDINVYTDSSGWLDVDTIERTSFEGAMRWITSKLRAEYPYAVIVFASPIQSAQAIHAMEYQLAKEAKMEKVCKRLSANLIKATSESGITGEFEVNNGMGRYLNDGLHPNELGGIVLGTYYANVLEDILKTLPRH